MGGNVDDNYYTSWKGSLQRLDMSGAEIMEDRENPYYTADARKMKFSISGKKKVGAEVISYVFHFENITEEEWKEAEILVSRIPQDIVSERTVRIIMPIILQQPEG